MPLLRQVKLLVKARMILVDFRLVALTGQDPLLKHLADLGLPALQTAELISSAVMTNGDIENSK